MNIDIYIVYYDVCLLRPIAFKEHYIRISDSDIILKISLGVNIFTLFLKICNSQDK